jgi:hypothetical protein
MGTSLKTGQSDALTFAVSILRDVLSRLAPTLEPPRVIVVSHHADERLWAEVLSLGGFDLLATPFR